MGTLKLAIADFTRAIELRPNYPKAYNSRGVVFMSNGYESSRAIADFDRAIALKPDFRYAYINRANARLVRHPWLALNDFHQAGMHPERVSHRRRCGHASCRVNCRTTTPSAQGKSLNRECTALMSGGRSGFNAVLGGPFARPPRVPDLASS